MNILIIIITTFLSIACAQAQTGIIKYTAKMNDQHKKEFIESIKKKDIDMNIKQTVIQSYNNAEPDYYELHFDKNESYYFKDEQLEKKNGYTMGSKAGLFPYYNNAKSKGTIELNSMMGNISHELLEWKTTNESKMIGDFKCYKATTTETLYSRQGHYYDRDIEVWFTPDIPVKFGPEHYNGLAGLVLEVKRNEFTIKASKINLNPDEKKLKIKRVEKDEKVISQKEMNKRIAEMMKDYNKG